MNSFYYQGKKERSTSILRLIDLAGREDPASLENDSPQISREGKLINQDMLALGMITRELAKKKQVPDFRYRQTPLLNLLQDSLGIFFFFFILILIVIFVSFFFRWEISFVNFSLCKSC